MLVLGGGGGLNLSVWGEIRVGTQQNFFHGTTVTCRKTIVRLSVHVMPFEPVSRRNGTCL